MCLSCFVISVAKQLKIHLVTMQCKSVIRDDRRNVCRSFRPSSLDFVRFSMLYQSVEDFRLVFALLTKHLSYFSTIFARFRTFLVILRSISLQRITLMRVNVRRANFTTKPCIENLNLRKFIYLNAQDSCYEKNSRAQRILFTNEAR